MRIEVRAARLAYGPHVVLDGLDATFEERRITALVGPSGSGKSTLLAAMAGYRGLDGGRIVLRDAEGMERAPSPALVGWVPQGANALGVRSVLDNVMIGPLSAGHSLRAAQQIAEAALDDVGLVELGRRQARSLSGGELQRVGFARALASGTPLVFADEPSSSLDAANTERIAALLEDLRQRATIVVATHDPQLIEAAECAVTLRGRSVDAHR